MDTGKEVCKINVKQFGQLVGKWPVIIFCPIYLMRFVTFQYDVAIPRNNFKLLLMVCLSIA